MGGGRPGRKDRAQVLRCICLYVCVIVCIFVYVCKFMWHAAYVWLFDGGVKVAVVFSLPDGVQIECCSVYLCANCT